MVSRIHVAHELVKPHAGRILIEDVAPHGAALIIELPRSGLATHPRSG